jgi:Ni/Co efflux regulator RcnB
MKTQAIALTLAVATLGVSTASFAQDWRGVRGDDRGQRFEQREDRREARRDAQEARRDLQDARRDAREARRDLAEARNDRFDNRRYDNRRWDNRYDGRGYVQAQRPQFYRGGYVPAAYRAPQYVVRDWHSRHLYAPPAGYQWMQVNGSDYVLAAIATGLIASVLLNQ